jgi:hypothetical protein
MFQSRTIKIFSIALTFIINIFSSVTFAEEHICTLSVSNNSPTSLYIPSIHLTVLPQNTMTMQKSCAFLKDHALPQKIVFDKKFETTGRCGECIIWMSPVPMKGEIYNDECYPCG